MKFSLSMITAAAILSPLVAADFDIFYQAPASRYGGESVWQAVNNEASTTDCTSMVGTRTYLVKEDVSGKKVGFRCKGKGCHLDGNVDDIEELEMNFGHKGSTVYHFTIRQWFREDNKWWMVGLDNQVYGYCSPATERAYACLAHQGKQKFFCKIDGLSEDDIIRDVRE
ncbi:hypothetical protein FVEN_g5535 [Fusarium venenatum]|uniref:Uncharacterized protein n=1 Tax=Fusarium venenatum TaxID=56646 RepID=A0A2L2TBE9_9HYPO|nr:uncharacterized protein FVRRES_08371 [Fusarium venenatum]KAG8356704.1 hypothetical protein FVEN_g5535 [Fusarium venenatum]KAH6965154.1 hypothetical protein EDB82DRAFT_511718 [Fusarium venenatum]CEI68294.1 unnamed protein product [Fusarium venenatum]